MWKDIPGWEGFYEANENGDIRSKERTSIYANGAKHCYKAKIKKPQLNPNGYLYVFLHRGKTHKMCKLSRLIATTFIPNPNNLRDVNHKNYNRLDNRVSNLEWVSHKDNIRHRFIGGSRKTSNRKVVCKNTGELYSSLTEAAIANNISISSVHKSARKGLFVNGYKWEYFN